jgi:hypothetical protein
MIAGNLVGPRPYIRILRYPDMTKPIIAPPFCQAAWVVKGIAVAAEICGLFLLLGIIVPGSAHAQDNALYSSMAPVEQYRVANRADEIALARSAAPASISGEAEVLVLGEHGYETAVKGTNGFVCLVERSWFAYFDDPLFWNPKIRSPDCLNPAAVSSVLPVNLEKTRWVLAGLSKARMIARFKSSATVKQAPARGAMGYMMSKQGYLSDSDGHWHPHLMFFQAHASPDAWGANLPGSPVLGVEGGPNEPTILFVPLGKWSDGTSAPMDMP